MTETRSDEVALSPGTDSLTVSRLRGWWDDLRHRAPRPGPNHRAAAPTVLQMESVECGAAALGMVLAHHGRHVPLEELRIACGVSRDGANAANLLRAARGYGLVAKGYKMETDELWTVRKPTIVFWAFQHFLVVEGIRRRLGRTTLTLNDPAFGRREMSWAEFDAGYTGIALTFEPGPDLVRDRGYDGLLPTLRRFRLPDRGAFWLTALAGLLLAVPTALVPVTVRVFVDDVLIDRRAGTLAAVLTTLTVAVVATCLLTAIQLGHVMRLQIATTVTATARFTHRLLRLPLTFFDQRRPAELVKRIAASNSAAGLVVGDVTTFAINVVVVAVYALVLAAEDLTIGLLGLALALLNVVLLGWISGSRGDVVAKQRAEEGNLAAVTFNSVQAIETVKASGVEHDVFARWAGYQGKVLAGEQRLAVPTAVLAAVPILLAGLNSGALLLVGGLRVVDGAITVGVLVAVQTLLVAVHRPVMQMSRTVGGWHDLGADLTRLSDVERYPVATVFEQEPETAVDPGPRRRITGALEVRDLSYGYATLSPPLIEGLSFTVTPGQRVALVGGSGSGKSTIGRLVAGLYEPWSGEILVGGRSRSRCDRVTLAASVAYVDQDVFLAEGTVRENLTLWDDSVPDEVVVAALQDAAIYDDLAARPGGLTGRVGEAGRNFSGGQRQRLAIARALVREPTLLVLDEAMSALDAETERRVDDNLRRRGCACLIIAHRLSTVRDADEILVLDQGRIVQRGRHRRLIAQAGAYADLITASA